MLLLARVGINGDDGQIDTCEHADLAGWGGRLPLLPPSWLGELAGWASACCNGSSPTQTSTRQRCWWFCAFASSLTCLHRVCLESNRKDVLSDLLS